MNEENKKQIIILAILLVVAAVFVYRSFGGGGIASPTPETPGVSSSLSTTPIDIFEDTDADAIDIASLMQKIKDVEFVYAENIEARNPAQPVSPRNVAPDPDAPRSDLPPADPRFVALGKKVTGIIWDATNPMAVVDDEVVHEGYVFPYEIVVKAIGEDHVILSFRTLDGEDDEITKKLVKE